MGIDNAVSSIQSGNTCVGIELGSTRIKAVLIDGAHQVLASGSFHWENRLENGLWTYALEDAISGVQACYASLKQEVRTRYGVTLRTTGAIGISGMMHGYIALDRDGVQLAPFLTWRNTNTPAAADCLTERFQFNIPLRWSVAQLYQAILEDQPHVARIGHLVTLAGYIHFLLTGTYAAGVGEASGMFPIDEGTLTYDRGMLAQFDALTADRGYPWHLGDILPQVLPAGAEAGRLTEAGALLLDASGDLRPGIPLAPPEGDAGTGMVATNSVAAATGNISAGTSIFSMVVLERKLSRLYRDIDMVTTPSGRPVAMIHCNNGTPEFDAWARIFREFADAAGIALSDEALFQVLYEQSLQGAPDCGGILLYNYLSGEPVAGLQTGAPLLFRPAGARFTLANFMRAQLYAMTAPLAMGMQILAREHVRIDCLTGHGGLFKTGGAAQRYLAAALRTSIMVRSTAGEGGPYGMAVLAAYMLRKGPDESLEEYLNGRVFAGAEGTVYTADAGACSDYERYLSRYRQGLAVEQLAAEILRKEGRN